MTSKRSEDRAEDLAADVSDLGDWRRGRHCAEAGRVPSTRITINLDADIVAIFKAEALRGGPPYQVAINQALRKFLRDRERNAREDAVTMVLRALEDESVREAIRRI